MGQHKHNPNCQLAKEGKLPPKPKQMSKREIDRLLYAKCKEILYKPFVDVNGRSLIEEYYKGEQHYE